MQHIELTRKSPYTAQQMFELVVDIGRYHEFVPYCKASRVRSREAAEGGTKILADLVVAYRFLRETYTSAVLLTEAPLAVTINQAENQAGQSLRRPFRHLYNRWEFIDIGAGSEVHFELQFDFAGPLLRRIIQPMMGRVAERFVAAFEARARVIYD